MTVVVLLSIGAAVVEFGSGQDESLATRDQEHGPPATAEDPSSHPPGGLEFVEALHGTPVWAAEGDATPVRSIDELVAVSGARSVVTGTVVAASLTEPLPLRLVPDQDQFDWGPGLRRVGVELAIRVESTAGEDLSRVVQDGTLRVHVPVWTGQVEEAQAGADFAAAVRDQAPLSSQMLVLIPDLSDVGGLVGLLDDGSVAPVTAFVSASGEGPTTAFQSFASGIADAFSLSEIRDGVTASLQERDTT